jgi:tetratricopeptide (TPR) repeat protein
MTVGLREIFLASGVNDVAELRAALRERIDRSRFARAIDLAREPANTSCVEALGTVRLRNADLAVVLLGSDYGTPGDGQELSATHLEYRAACAAKVPVLPCFIGGAVASPGAVTEPSAGGPLAALQREIRARHVAGILPVPLEPSALADIIFRRVCEFFLEPPRDAQGEGEEESGSLGQLPGEDSEWFRRSNQHGTERWYSSELDVQLHPARTAAEEQRSEARRALAIGDRQAAIAHLRKALEHRPLDFEVGVTLARLLSTSTRIGHCRESARLARRMARLAAFEANAAGQGAALALAARAELAQGNSESALELAGLAIAAAESRASVRVECALLYAALGAMPLALQECERVYRLWPEAFARLEREPTLRTAAEFRALKGQLNAELRKVVAQIELGERNNTELLAVLDGQRGRDEAPDSGQGALDLELPGPSAPLIGAVRVGQKRAKNALRQLQRCASGLVALRQRVEAQQRAILALTAAGPPLGGQPWLASCALLGALALLALPPSLWLIPSAWRWSPLWLLVVSGGGLSFLYARIRAAFTERLGLSTKLQRQYESELETFAARLGQRIADFEAHVVSPLNGILSPSVSPNGATLEKLVRIQVADASVREFVLDTQLLAPELGAGPVGDARPESEAQLFRVIRKQDGRWVASRYACYFDLDQLAEQRWQPRPITTTPVTDAVREVTGMASLAQQG